MRIPRNDNAQARKEATEWFIAFCEHDMDPRGRDEFISWLRASPAHVRTYLQVSALWEASGNLHARRKLEVEDLVQRASSGSNVVALAASGAARTVTVRRQWNGWRATIVASGVILIAGISTYGIQMRLGLAATYATPAGQHRTLTLSDGSIVILDARSSMRVRMRKDARLIELLEGQALFEVAKNPDRPFIVRSGTASVRAVGTQFDVNRMQSETVVTVAEGRVAVMASGAGATDRKAASQPKSVLVSSGERVTLGVSTMTSPAAADASAATAWTAGWLVFEATPLSHVVETINRYSRRQLVIDAPELLGMHLQGTFAATDISLIIAFLERRFGLTARETATSIVLSRS